MSTSESMLRAAVAQFRPRALEAGFRHKLSNTRDLLCRSLYDVAYSHAMVRARAEKLEPARLRPDRVLRAAEAFHVDAPTLYALLTECVAPVRAIHDAARGVFNAPAGVIGIVGPRDAARTGVLLTVLRAYGACFFESRLLRALHSQHPDLPVDLSPARHTPALREHGTPYAQRLRRAVRFVRHGDTDGVAFDAVETDAMVRPVAELVTDTRHAIVVADRRALLDAVMQAAPTRANHFDEKIRARERLVFEMSTHGVTCSPWVAPDRDSAAAVHVSVPARYAAWLIDHAQPDRGFDDVLIAEAARNIVDELGRLANPDLARDDIEKVLVAERVPIEEARHLASRVLSAVRSLERHDPIANEAAVAAPERIGS